MFYIMLDLDEGRLYFSTILTIVVYVKLRGYETILQLPNKQRVYFGTYTNTFAQVLLHRGCCFSICYWLHDQKDNTRLHTCIPSHYLPDMYTDVFM